MPYFVWLRLEKQLWKLWLIKGVSLIVVCGYILIWGVKQWVLECFSAELLSCRYKIGFLCFFCLLWMWHLESNVLRFMFICVLFNIGCDAYWLFFLLLFMFLLLLNLLAFKWWWAFFSFKFCLTLFDCTLRSTCERFDWWKVSGWYLFAVYCLVLGVKNCVSECCRLAV